MAKYKTDLRDLEFNLIEWLRCHELNEGFEESDLKEIISQFDRFVENEVYPNRQKADEDGVKLTPEGVVAPAYYKKALEGFHANGWFGIGLPEEFGGMPVPESVSVACTSIVNGADVAFSMYHGLTKGALNVIRMVGTDEQKNTFIPPMVEGRFGGTMCLTEPGAGSDVGAAKTTATPNDDGSYNIKGVKIFISAGENDLYDNIIHLVLARTPGAPEGTKGLSLFIVPRLNLESGTSNDVKCTKIEEKMGIHSSATCELTFGQNGSCKGELIGKEFEGMANMFILMNEARLLCGLQGESQGNLAYELSVQYAKERSQFGTEIINIPDVKRLLLKMRATGRGMRALNLYVANLFDKEKKGEEGAEELVAFFTPVCKAFGSEEGFNVSVDAIQVHGGYGFCSEYGIEQFARDTKIATIYEGTNAIQAADFVSRKILKDGGKSFKLWSDLIRETLKNVSDDLSHEAGLVNQSLNDAQKILEKFGTLAAEKKFNEVLYHSWSFLRFAGNLATAWLLLDSANMAKEKYAEASDAEKAFYSSKIIDVKVFCEQNLVLNSGIAQGILTSRDSLTSANL